MVRSTTAAFAAVLAASCLHLAAATPALILNQIYPLVMEQLDPIISPNAMSSHMHSVFGGSGFGAAYNYADSQAASCSSTYMSVDKSNYWAPLLYWSPDPYASSPVFYPAQSGLRVYYFLGRQGTAPVSPFPPGLRMIVGSPFSKTPSSFIQHSCATSSSEYYTQDNFNMNQTCEKGVRTIIYFPPCWDGVNLYKADQSHVAYPVQGLRDGSCPWTHPVKMPAMLFELTWILPPQASGQNVAGHLIWSFGDTTGYGAHADFTNGWDTNVLGKILNDSSCTGVNAANVFEWCGAAQPYINSGAAQSCKPDKGVLQESIPVVPWSPVPALPGCNPPWASGAKPGCSTQPPSPNIGPFMGTDGAYAVSAADSQAIKWPTAAGWWSITCMPNLGSGEPLFTSSVSFLSSSMTVEQCTSSCARGGYKFAALSSVPSVQCQCGTALTNVAAITTQDQCNIACPGNSNQMCGGNYNWNLYYTPDPTTAASANSTAVSDPSQLGCYQNPSPLATANGLAATAAYSFQSSSMTVETCKSGCQSFNYDWAAVTNGQTCYCGTEAKFTLGSGTYVPQVQCSTACMGNKTEYCGGYNLLDIYNISVSAAPGSTAPATAVPSGKSAGWLSCRNESPRGLTAAGATVSAMTPDYCRVGCAELGYSLAGLSFGNRCYCDNAYSGGGILPVAQCDTTCAGSANFTCGGSYTLDLYNSTAGTPSNPAPASIRLAGWQGCYPDGTLTSAYSFVSQTMTPDICLSGCAATGYAFAGVDAKTCFCGNTLGTGARLMTAPNCNNACAGNGGVGCGGYKNSDVYKLSDSKYGSASNATSGATGPMCYGSASSGALALNGPTFVLNTMTNAVCATGCLELGYKYSGTKGGNTCVCGNTIDTTAGKQAPALCGTACAGASTETCGASTYMSISTASTIGQAPAPGLGYVGCFAEASTGKGLTGYSYGATSMTNGLCKMACVKAGYSLAGTENGNMCYCGNAFGGGAQTASATCTSACAGNATQSCGGGNSFISLWNSTVTTTETPPAGSNSTNTTTPAAGGSSASTGYLGCFTDTQTVNTVFYSSALMSNSVCVQQCNTMGYAYAATANGNICRCGNTVAKALTQKTNCATPCAGTTTNEMCGGGTSAVTVYDVNAAETNLLAQGLAQNQTFGPLGSMGCRSNGAKGALLAGSAISTSTMTPTMCIQTCGQQGYALAGTISGSYCWCDNAMQNSLGGGNVLPDSSCNKPCSGDATKMCGASGILNVYNVKASGVDTSVLSSPGYQGCYAPGTFISAAAFIDNNGYMTPDTCRVSCGYKGYAYAGLAGGRNCYCSATSTMGTKLGDVSCSTKCSGDNTQMCGATNIISVFTTKGAVAAKPGQPANYRGCFQNSGSPNVMPNWSLGSANMSPALCQQNCKTLGYQFAALEGGNICRCGTAIPPSLYSDAACSSPCTGMSSTTCGGYHADAVYDVTAAGTVVSSVAASSSAMPNASTSATSKSPSSSSAIISTSSQPVTASFTAASSAKVVSQSSTIASSSKASSAVASSSSAKPASVSVSSSSKPASVSVSSSSKSASVSMTSSSKPASASSSSVKVSSSVPVTVSSSKLASSSATSAASSIKLASSFTSVSTSTKPANSTSSSKAASSSLPSPVLVATSSSSGCAAGSTEFVTHTVTVTAGASSSPIAKRSRGKAWAKRLYRESSGN